ncbi:hypothetical protein M569_02997, partial [Genlisea aurea]
HLALLPVAGMGHLMPFLRLGAMLAARGATVTIITAHPTVTTAESDHLSRFFSQFPAINRLEFHLIPREEYNSELKNDDPFFIQFESIGKSAHLLVPQLSSLSPPLSALVADFPVNAALSEISDALSIPLYTLITTSARFFTIMFHLPRILEDNKKEAIEIPKLGKIPSSSIPPIMLDQAHFFSSFITSNALTLHKSKGILINTFHSFEPEAIQCLTNPLPCPILPIGPLDVYDQHQPFNLLPWLDNQSPGSVVYVSFGNRTSLSKQQLQELGHGLEKSRCKFLWVVKSKKVDTEDTEGIDEILGGPFVERNKERGMILKGWVDQEKILGHPSVGGFMSHCGWNSVMEAARLGVPILAWPQHGDQRINADVVEKGGLGIWPEEWGWLGQKLVKRDEISNMISKLMGENEGCIEKAQLVKEKANAAKQVGNES